MAAETVPWWRKAVQFVWKSIRAVARVDNRSNGARGQTASSEKAIDEPGFDEPAVEKIDAGASLQQEVEETALNQESPERLPEESPKPDPKVTPDPVHDPAAAGPAAQPEDARETPAEPVEAQPELTAPDEAAEEAPSLPTDVLEEAGAEDEEPEPPVTGIIEEPAEVETEAAPEVVEAIAESRAEQEAAEPEAETGLESDGSHAEAGADAEAPEIEAAEAAFDQPVETPAEEAAETALVEDAVGGLPEQPAEQQASAADDAGQQGSEPAEAEGTATGTEQPQAPPVPTVPTQMAQTAQAAQAAAPQVTQAVKREEGPDTSPFSVLVSQVYEGPLDLLLDLIRKQDIDIYDIPIAKITAQFLAYVNQLKASDMDVAGEFIYTASLLIHIKSKMLLPRAPAGPDEVQEDPRRELVERLLEHERFKNAAQMLQQKQMLESATWTNPGMREFRDDAKADAEIAADTTDLVRIFREILERARNRPVFDLQEDSVTVGQMIQFLTRRLTMEDKPVALRLLLSQTRSERALIAMFLALLELVRLQAILLRQDRQFSEIFIKKNSGFDAFMNQGAARDDWQ
jgi:segregation and condensation protein A